MMSKKVEQLNFFGGGGEGADLEPPPGDWPASLLELAASLPPHVRMGTSSWTFPAWKGIVYRRDYGDQKTFVARSLEEYVSHPLLTTAGIDRSHYAPLKEEEWKAYAKQLPAGYRCAAKVWDEVTTMVFPDHPRFGKRRGQLNPKFLDPQHFDEFVATPLLAGFREHLGPQILEVPPMRQDPNPRAFEDDLAAFLERAPSGLFYAVELRNRNLLTQRYLSILKHFRASHVLNFWTGMPSLREQLSLPGALPGPCTVVRLMLPPYSSYERRKQAMEPFNRLVEVQSEMRADVVELIRRTGELGHKLYVLVGNKAEGCSPLTVQGIAELWARGQP